MDDALKTEDCAEAYNPEGLVPRAVRLLKGKVADTTDDTHCTCSGGVYASHGRKS